MFSLIQVQPQNTSRVKKDMFTALSPVQTGLHQMAVRSNSAHVHFDCVSIYGHVTCALQVLLANMKSLSIGTEEHK